MSEIKFQAQIKKFSLERAEDSKILKIITVNSKVKRHALFYKSIFKFGDRYDQLLSKNLSSELDRGLS